MTTEPRTPPLRELFIVDLSSLDQGASTSSAPGRNDCDPEEDSNHEPSSSGKHRRPRASVCRCLGSLGTCQGCSLCGLADFEALHFILELADQFFVTSHRVHPFRSGREAGDGTLPPLDTGHRRSPVRPTY